MKKIHNNRNGKKMHQKWWCPEKDRVSIIYLLFCYRKWHVLSMLKRFIQNPKVVESMIVYARRVDDFVSMSWQYCLFNTFNLSGIMPSLHGLMNIFIRKESSVLIDKVLLFYGPLFMPKIADSSHKTNASFVQNKKKN